VAASLEAAGLSERFVNKALLGATCLLAGLFAFIFTVISAWSDGGSFAAVIESMLVTAAGLAVRFGSAKTRSLMPAAARARGAAHNKVV